ncbi:restriction endonuclease, partial [Klebsiella pneumoniae]|uniref:restriction endonuclease n=1 Tax=Klebsiella pneumoniae TaxID=573 RepID=UPI00406AB322
HPTKFTNADGNPLSEVLSSDLGVLQDYTKSPLDSYLFEEVFYDSELERLNITDKEILSVAVFTKIPKNSIKIPVAGGYTYSPDFAYVVDGKDSLRLEEQRKIEHAQVLFNQISKTFKVEFMTQFANDEIYDLIKKTQA